MAKKAAPAAGMDHAERLAGTIFFVVYLLVMPLLADRLFALSALLLDTRIDAALQNALYYYVLTAVTLLIFHRYLANSASRFFGDAGRSLAALFLGLLVFYGANELLFRVLRLFLGRGVNLNDVTIAAQIGDVPRVTPLIAVLLSPFVEEVLFRGLVFGCVREKSRAAAYALSALLYALLQVWAFLLSSRDLSSLALTGQYLVPGLVFAWACDRSGTLWTAILLHAAVNALSLWVAI